MATAILCLAPAMAGWTAASNATPGPKVEVHDPAAASDLEKRGARLIADYGAYKLFEAPDTKSLARLNDKARIRNEYNLVRLNAGEIDTSKAEVRAARKTLGSFTGKRLHLVQFAGPPLPSWVQDLREAGVRIVAYLPHNAYLVFGDAAALKQVQALASQKATVQWDGPYLDAHKIQPDTHAQKLPLKLGKAATDAFAIQLVDDPDNSPKTIALLDQLKLDAPIRFDRTRGFVNLVLRLAASDLSAVAAQPDVISIRPYYPRAKTGERLDQIVAGNLDGNLPSGPGYLDWLASKGFEQSQFTASDFVVDVADSGLDNGTTLPNHFGLYAGGELTSTSRVAYARLEGRANASSTIRGCDGHGTLNGHIIAGYDYRSGFPHTDSDGYHYGLGVCPFVKLGSSVIFDPSWFTSPVYPDMLSRAYQSGARISSNSWGGYGDGSYDVDAQEYDALVRDAQPANAAIPAAGNQEMVIVFAAGNDGENGSTTINPPGSAKNVLCVGASENVQSIGGTDSSGISDSGANSANDIATFSSRGPCLDGRQKPDLVAPGTHVSGGVFQTNLPGPTGGADPCFTGEGVSGGPSGSIFFPLSQQFFTASSGTSHATPAVAGGAALLRQYFINHGWAPPSPAMTKACLVNSARYLTGSGANDNLWSPRQGMGGLDLGRAFDDTLRILRDQVADDLFTASGQTRTFTATVDNTNQPVRITLAWTDAPGSTTGSAYNNDIDLVVTVNGTPYLGNVFSGAYSTTGGTADFKNNLESVILPAGTTGTVAIQITAININSDGVPNNDYAVDQDFALVAYNTKLVLLPSIREAGAKLASETCSPTNGVIDPGEMVTVDFGLRNVGTLATSNLTATLLSTGSVVALTSAPQAYGVLTPGGDIVSQSFTFVSTGVCGESVTALLQLQDGTNNLGTAEFTLPLGAVITTTNYAEGFDYVTPPMILTAWTASSISNGVAPVTTTAQADSAPNSVFFAEPLLPGISELTSPELPVRTRQAQLAFRHRYDTEVDSYSTSLAFDGGVLEIKVGTNAFQDILSAGGSFVTGGYNRQIDNSTDNVFIGRRVWAGNSGAFVDALVDLPAAASGSTVQFKWRFATDSGNYYGGTGWYLDTIAYIDGSYSCCTSTGAVPVNVEAVLTGTNVVVQVQHTTLGFNYILEYKDDLQAASAWTEIQPPVAGTGGSILLEDPAGAGTRRFYRVRVFQP